MCESLDIKDEKNKIYYYQQMIMYFQDYLDIKEMKTLSLTFGRIITSIF